MRKIGELFLLRTNINSVGSVLDSPVRPLPFQSQAKSRQPPSHTDRATLTTLPLPACTGSLLDIPRPPAAIRRGAELPRDPAAHRPAQRARGGPAGHAAAAQGDGHEPARRTPRADRHRAHCRRDRCVTPLARSPAWPRCADATRSSPCLPPSNHTRARSHSSRYHHDPRRPVFVRRRRRSTPTTLDSMASKRGCLLHAMLITRIARSEHIAHLYTNPHVFFGSWTYHRHNRTHHRCLLE